jgi:PKD repeat protein
MCEGERIIIGKLATGGTGFKSFKWSPSDSLDFDNQVLTWANPIITTTYTMLIKDDLLCEITDSTKVVVHPAPIADFSFTDTCENELYYFKNLSQKKDIGFDSTHWKIGSEEFLFWEPIVLMDSSYQVHAQLYVRDSFGCWDSTSKTLDVFPRPKPSFTFADGCAETLITFTNTSSIAAGTYNTLWTTAGVDNVSTDLQKAFSTYGSKAVKMKVTSDRGCADSLSQNIEIFEKPDLEIILDSVCEGQLSTLGIKTNFKSADTLIGYSWDLGDGQSANSRTILHKYSFDGSYLVELIALSNNLCADTVSETAIVYQKPEASFTIQKACLGDANELVNTTLEDKFTIASVRWDDGNGYIVGSDTQNFTFSTIGMHPVSLIIESAESCTDTLTKDALVLHKESLNMVQNGNCENDVISLNYTPQFRDTISGIRWIYNSSTVGGLEQLNYNFGTSGTHTLTLEVDLLNGCASNKSFDVLLDPKPTSLFSFTLPCSDNQVEFNSLASTSSGTISLEEWDLGDGTTSTNSNVNHSYALGSFATELIVTNSFGCKDTSSRVVDIKNVVQTSFEAVDICANDLQTIRDLSIGNTVPIQSYLFDLGDGNSSDQASFDYAYSEGGSYTITLTIETTPGCTYQASKTITVYNAPTPGFTLDKTRLDLVDNKIVLTDASIGGTQYEYTITDGSFYSTANLEHEFQDTGVFTIEQKVTDDFGCFAIFSDSTPVYMITNILVPNAFHPNKDGLNEEFRPEGLGIKSFELEVYDRWGGKVYESFDSKSWDGSDYPPGVYVYHIRVIDFEQRFHEFNGLIHLLR